MLPSRALHSHGQGGTVVPEGSCGPGLIPPTGSGRALLHMHTHSPGTFILSPFNRPVPEASLPRPPSGELKGIPWRHFLYSDSYCFSPSPSATSSPKVHETANLLFTAPLAMKETTPDPPDPPRMLLQGRNGTGALEFSLGGLSFILQQ